MKVNASCREQRKASRRLSVLLWFLLKSFQSASSPSKMLLSVARCFSLLLLFVELICSTLELFVNVCWSFCCVVVLPREWILFCSGVWTPCWFCDMFVFSSCIGEKCGCDLGLTVFHWRSGNRDGPRGGNRGGTRCCAIVLLIGNDSWLDSSFLRSSIAVGNEFAVLCWSLFCAPETGAFEVLPKLWRRPWRSS